MLEKFIQVIELEKSKTKGKLIIFTINYKTLSHNSHSLSLSIANFFHNSLSLYIYIIGNNIGLRMGSDFHYTNADIWYKNIDKLIKAMKSKYSDKYHVFYSTPEMYTQAKHAENLDWLVIYFHPVPLVRGNRPIELIKDFLNSYH